VRATVLIPQQIRAARALLGWSQGQLAAAAGVGEMTVKRFEADKGEVSGTISSLQRIRTALEHAGIEFIDATQEKGSGVRLAKP
jgi:transcriptional regulator with XRE-family HTH domain